VSVSSGSQYEDPVAALLKHVPGTFSSSCTATTPNTKVGQTAAFVCNPAGDVDQAEYYQYTGKQAMDDDFDAIIKQSGADLSGSDCSVGPSEYGYAINKVHAGRLSCYANPGSLGGLLFMWTDEQLGIIAIGVSTSFTYSQLNDWWKGDTSGPVR